MTEIREAERREFKRSELQAVRDLMCNHDVAAIESEAIFAYRARLLAAVERLPQPTLGLAGGVSRAAVRALIVEQL